ncbi:hypothetical protein [Petrimonas sulfuriphila]|uniref:hypothetical protein n=1 Tax=Petrimonas sulfuriphila TaxID=285070 RepID=UPI003EBC55CE
MTREEIQKKAEEYKNKVYEDVYQESDLAEQKLLCINDFTAGANFILDKLRFKNPKEELPEIGEKVIVKTSNGKYAITEMYTPKDCRGTILGKKEWRGSYTFKNSIVGWREIIEP